MWLPNHSRFPWRFIAYRKIKSSSDLVYGLTCRAFLECARVCFVAGVGILSLSCLWVAVVDAHEQPEDSLVFDLPFRTKGNAVNIP